MKIVAGLGSVDEYIPYVQAGADELFCGYVPYNWTKKYGTVLPLNRREVLAYNVQLGSFSELEILSEMIGKYRKPVHIAMNSLYYIPEQYEEIADIVKQCMKIGFDSFILADPALILYLRQKGISCKIHLSGEVGEMNREAIKVFQEMGIDRIIFHRKNTVASMRQMIEAVNTERLEFEAFALNELCQFTGAFCNSLHCDEMYNAAHSAKEQVEGITKNIYATVLTLMSIFIAMFSVITLNAKGLPVPQTGIGVIFYNFVLIGAMSAFVLMVSFLIDRISCKVKCGLMGIFIICFIGALLLVDKL